MYPKVFSMKCRQGYTINKIVYPPVRQQYKQLKTLLLYGELHKSKTTVHDRIHSNSVARFSEYCLCSWNILTGEFFSALLSILSELEREKQWNSGIHWNRAKPPPKPHRRKNNRQRSSGNFFFLKTRSDF